MQMVKKVCLMLFLVWFGMLVFMPKKELYYKLEEVLARQEIQIDGEKLKEGWFSLEVENLSVSIKGIKIATVEKVDFFTLLFSSKMHIQNILLDDSLKGKAPNRTENATLAHTVLSPLSVSLDAQCDFGGIEGKAKIKERSVRLDLIEAKNIDMIKSQLKQDEKGWYYEASF